MRIPICLYVGLFAAAAALSAQSIIHSDFDKDAGGWVVAGPDSASVPIMHGRGKNGTNALEFAFDASDVKPAVLRLSIHESLQDMKSIRLWLMADFVTTAAVTLREKPGGRYVAITWLRPNEWQYVELTPEDFVLSEAWKDPKDPDGKLDLDKIDAVEIEDLGQTYNAGHAYQGHFVIDEHSGPQKLSVSEFEISAESPSWFHGKSPFEIDRFDHPQLQWYAWGGADLKLDDSHSVMKDNALMATYQQMEDTFTPLFRALRPMDFSGATHLAFDIASTNDAHILIAFREPTATKTASSVVEVKGGKPEHHLIELVAFEQRNQNAFAHANLNTLLVQDITAQYTHKTVENTLRISNIELVNETIALR